MRLRNVSSKKFRRVWRKVYCVFRLYATGIIAWSTNLPCTITWIGNDSIGWQMHINLVGSGKMCKVYFSRDEFLQSSFLSSPYLNENNKSVKGYSL